MQSRIPFPISFQDNLILYLCLGYGLLSAWLVPGFASSANFWNLLFNLLPLLIVCIGQMVVMLTAGIDLSVTSSVALFQLAGSLRYEQRLRAVFFSPLWGFSWVLC